MNQYEWMVIGAIAFVFFLLAISTQRYLLMFLTFMWIVVGALLSFFIMKASVLAGFAVLMFWCIYPIGRSLRRPKDDD